jgi:hypothetical protein
MALLERFELPSLRQLIDARSTVTVWQHSSDGGQSQRVDPAQTDLRLRLEAPLRHDETGLFGFRLWSFHDREDAVLLRAPTLTECPDCAERTLRPPSWCTMRSVSWTSSTLLALSTPVRSG